MKERVLPRDYSVEEMNRGEGMRFHPVEGSLLRDLFFSWASQCFYIFVGGFSLDFPVIGDGQRHAHGDPYLGHWQYDPFTGRSLNAPMLTFDERTSDDDVTGGEW